MNLIRGEVPSQSHQEETSKVQVFLIDRCLRRYYRIPLMNEAKVFSLFNLICRLDHVFYLSTAILEILSIASPFPRNYGAKILLKGSIRENNTYMY